MMEFDSINNDSLITCSCAPLEEAALFGQRISCFTAYRSYTTVYYNKTWVGGVSPLEQQEPSRFQHFKTNQRLHMKRSLQQQRVSYLTNVSFKISTIKKN